ncbi:D-glycerate dehydrogenase [Candidatus Curtissbacteria bacterium RBG_16_39_7]|uniref:D-glycerate dehydrogenase n=1 Tax=Candidatus Curtissbacteria bacterium RBG_16_39_7 TaxID=1797707 RepID=A0A1F5G460_9BACT|nr:MAG: D-glycerate dehydrogenase [Candidatus Curtissbacteria bacterium RBG_16_39_7]
MSKVFVCRPISEVGINFLKEKGFEVILNSEDRVLSKDELKEKVKGVDAILSLLTDKMDGEVMDAAGPQLKVIANYAVGFDNINIEATKQRNIMVTNTPGVLTEAVAEHTFALLLACAKHIVEADRFTSEGKFKQWEPKGFLGPQLQGKTLGIVGLGRIGSMVAQIAKKGFEMKIVYYDVKPNPDFEREFEASFLSVEDLLKNSDFVTIHVPLLPQTRHFINEEKLKMMKKEAVLINTARGPIVDEQALIRALKEGWIAAAGLDVFEFEPNLSPGLVELPNVVLTPHTASATYEARNAMSRMAAENIAAVLSGQTPPNLVK